MANRPKMDQAERAKQFMPFAALKGYEEALRERERRLADGEDGTAETRRRDMLKPEQRK